MSISQLSIQEILLPDGRMLNKEHLAIERERTIQHDELVVHDLFTFHNYGAEPISFPLALTFQAGFEDVFAVRGAISERRGSLKPPRWQNHQLLFTYNGTDGLHRSLAISFSVQPRRPTSNTGNFRIMLGPRSSKKLLVSLAASELPHEVRSLPNRSPDLRGFQAHLRRASDDWRAGETQIGGSSLTLNAIVDRSLRDLRMLRSKVGDHEYFAAGVPWFATLFGRDSLITALQTLAFDPRIAEQTLRVLASYQGREVNEWRDEEPGKILHELRTGEMARTGEVPHTPYYGSVDATPLFLLLIAWHASWTGSLSLFHERGRTSSAR